MSSTSEFLTVSRVLRRLDLKIHIYCKAGCFVQTERSTGSSSKFHHCSNWKTRCRVWEILQVLPILQQPECSVFAPAGGQPAADTGGQRDGGRTARLHHCSGGDAATCARRPAAGGTSCSRRFGINSSNESASQHGWSGRGSRRRQSCNVSPRSGGGGWVNYLGGQSGQLPWCIRPEQSGCDSGGG